jgi:endonuclease/exonuclease/phosphatase family metal-dependent hydrolase
VYVGGVHLRVLTWNLMHGRSVPPSGRDLFGEFAAALERWSWDVALLQEVPPWWSPGLGSRLGAEHRQVLTSRNALPALRRAVASRWPDVAKSNGGGANVILARRDRIVVHRTQRLCRLPERRWAHGVRLACGIWFVNLHATADDEAAAWRDGSLAAGTASGWGGREPIVLGGDFNLRRPVWPGFAAVAGRDVDHILLNGPVQADGEQALLDRGELSDHVPLAIGLRVNER